MANITGAIKALAVIVQLSGFASVWGWVFDITFLKSVLPSFVTMKLSTAISFILSGLILYFLPNLIRGKGPWPWVVMPVAVLIILLIMTTLLASSLFGISTGLEQLIIPEEEGAIKTVKPGVPSIITMADFILIAVTGLSAFFLTGRLPKVLGTAGIILIITGAVAEAGYIFGIESLYYEIKGVSTAMAVHTAFLFIILGAGFLLAHGLALRSKNED